MDTLGLPAGLGVCCLYTTCPNQWVFKDFSQMPAVVKQKKKKNKRKKESLHNSGESDDIKKLHICCTHTTTNKNTNKKKTHWSVNWIRRNTTVLCHIIFYSTFWCILLLFILLVHILNEQKHRLNTIFTNTPLQVKIQHSRSSAAWVQTEWGDHISPLPAPLQLKILLLLQSLNDILKTS